MRRILMLALALFAATAMAADTVIVLKALRTQHSGLLLTRRARRAF